MKVHYPLAHKREGQAVLFYAAKYVDTLDYCIYIPVHGNCADKQAFLPSLPYGRTAITYKKEEIVIDYNKLSKPISTEGNIIIPSEGYIECKNKEILDDFIKTSQKIYSEEIYNNEKKIGSVTCYIWDDYWEVLNKKKNRPIESLCFSDNMHIDLLRDIKDFLSFETEQEYNNFGIPYKMNILLEGYPGTGKSSLIYALASDLEMNVATITFDSELTDRQFVKAVKRVPKNTIIMIEDIDAAFKDRTEKGDHIALTFSSLLNTLDGNCSVDKQIIIMTTNFKCNLDEALIRPGRIDKCIHFDYSSKEQIQLIFSKFVKDESLFKTFYKEIKNYKLTTAMLQQYLFSNRKNGKIIENIEELKKISSEANYGKSNLQLYN